MQDLCRAHIDVEKLLKSKKTKFVGGRGALQERWTRAIECHLRLMTKNGQRSPDAAKRAAEGQGFATKWGSRQVRSWT
jgi:hypothetical protein